MKREASDSVDELFRSRWGPSVRLATALTGDRGVAEELVQDALLEVTRQWDDLDNPEGFLRTVLVNRCRNHQRHIGVGRRRQPPPPRLVVEDPSLDGLWHVLAGLPARRRAALVLRYYEDLPVGEIARLIDAIDVGPAPAPPAAGHPPSDQEDTPMVDLGTITRIEPKQRYRSRARLLLGVAAAAAVLLGAAVVVTQLGDDDEGTAPSGTVNAGKPDVRRLIPTELPAGTSESSLQELPLSEDALTPGRTSVSVYGDPSGTDPFAAADLGIFVVVGETFGYDGPEAPVRGHQGYAGSDVEANDVGINPTRPAQWLSWNETDEVEVTLVSRTLSADVLSGIAENLAVDGEHVTLGELPADLPGSLERLATLEEISWGGAYLAPLEADGYYDYYYSPAQSGAAFEIAALEDVTGTGQIVARWMIDGERVDVRGGEGWMARRTAGLDSTSSITTVIWNESPSVLNTVSAIDLTADETLGLVEGLAPAISG